MATSRRSASSWTSAAARATSAPRSTRCQGSGRRRHGRRVWTCRIWSTSADRRAGLRLHDVGVVLDLLGRAQPLEAERLGGAGEHGQRRPQLVRDVEHEVGLELRQADRLAVHADRADDRDQQQADDRAEQPEARRRAVGQRRLGPHDQPPARHRRQRRQVVAQLAAGEEQQVEALGRRRQAAGVVVGPGDAASAGVLDAQRQARQLGARVEQRLEAGGGEAAEAVRPAGRRDRRGSR